MQQQLADDRRDPLEMPGAERAVEALADPADPHARHKASRIHLFDWRRENEVDPGPLERREIGRLVARIGGKILGRPELLRVDEQRRDDPFVFAARGRDQRKVPGMDRAHRRDKPDPVAPRAPRGDLAPQIGDGSRDLHPARSAPPAAISPFALSASPSTRR